MAADLDKYRAVAGCSVDPRHRALASVKLGEVRAALSPDVYRRSSVTALGWLAFDLCLYSAFIAGAFVASNPLLKLAFGVLAGCAVSYLFVWGHDAAHGALFTSERVSEALGTIAMLPSLNMYRLWTYGHNKVHHGFTSFSPIDWIWRPLTPAEYRDASRRRRMHYRIERSLSGCALHYARRVWWNGMVRFRADAAVCRRFHFTRARLIMGVFVVAASVLSWRLGGGWLGVVAAVIVPWVVFNYHIALIVYLQHTHPSLPFFLERGRWSSSIGQVACSTTVRLSRLLEMLTHNILIHTPHHVDMRIPFYRLRRARRDLGAAFGEHLVEYRFTWSTVRQIFRTCQLFDFDTQVWYRFRDAAVAAEPLV